MQHIRYPYKYHLAALLLGAALTKAHVHNGLGDVAMDIGGNASLTTLRPAASLSVNVNNMGPRSYFVLDAHSGLICSHIIIMTFGWLFVLPLGVMLSIARSHLTLPFQVGFLSLNALGLITGTLYNNRTPDLYENNAHHKLGWILTSAVSVQVLIGFLSGYMGEGHWRSLSKEKGSSFPISHEALAQHQRDVAQRVSPTYRYSKDSGQGTERASSSSSRCSVTLESDHERQGLIESRSPPGYGGDDTEDAGNVNLLGSISLPLMGALSGSLLKRVATATAIVYKAVDRLILVLAFVELATGLVTYGGIFRGNHVFNGLAHFVKGGIFFWYGVLTLGRWMGCFADLGWAWNIKPPKSIIGSRKAGAPSAEFVESFVIFLYGSTNVFLEHLAAWGDAWTPQDLEHVSISVLFFGGGLCGMLVESTKIRNLLNVSVRSLSDRLEPREFRDIWQPPKAYSFSMNPLPGIVILLLGLMMSSHHQTSGTSMMVHKQWGLLLLGASLARVSTYAIFYLSPPSSVLPSRPPSELISSFCLMSGGLIFMASNKDTVAAMDSHNVDAIVIFTLTMGLTALLMAWVIIVVAVKGWATRHVIGSLPSKAPFM